MEKKLKIGLPLKIWRSIVADRQSKTAQQQSETAAQRDWLDKRYQKSEEMLGNEGLSVRLGGIYSLERLAREHAEDYHIQIVKLFCAFVRNPPKDEHDNDAPSDTPQEEHPKIREDVQTIMTALGRRNEEQQKIEKRKISKEPILNLAGANLSGAVLERADLSGVVLERADLSGAQLNHADLSGAVLERADLSGAVFHDAKLSGAWLKDANLSRAEFNGAKLSDAVLDGANLYRAELYEADLSRARLEGADLSVAGLYRANLSSARLEGADLSVTGLNGARGLTQAQLDQTVVDPNDPPNLTNAKDSKTGEPLVWRGGILSESSS